VKFDWTNHAIATAINPTRHRSSSGATVRQAGMTIAARMIAAHTATPARPSSDAFDSAMLCAVPTLVSG
jgi:hypothetical protein